MKYLLTCIVLLSNAHYAYADMTLEFKELISQNGLTFSIKNKQLKLNLQGQKRLNLFDQKNNSFLSFDPDSSKTSIINEEVLKQREIQLNNARLKKLVEVERNLQLKLKTMSQSEQETGEALINALKYPEVYGAHTRLTIEKLDTLKQIHKISCQTYQLYRDKKLLKEFCMADAKALKLSPQDYQTLRSFYSFNYHMQSRLLLAAGNTSFSLIDYEKEKITGINIESIDYKGKNIVQHLTLNHLKPAADTSIKSISPQIK